VTFPRHLQLCKIWWKSVHGGFWANRWNITKYFFYFYPFLSNSRTGQTAHHIFTLDGSNDVDSRKVCLFGFGWYCSPFRGSNFSQKKQFWGVNRGFSAKLSKYWNVHIIKTAASIITKFCRVIEIRKYSQWVVQMCSNKSKIVDGRHLEKLKNPNIFATDWLIWTKFSVLIRLDPLDPDTQ